MHVCIYMMCIYIYTYICVYIYVWVHIYIYTHTPLRSRGSKLQILEFLIAMTVSVWLGLERTFDKFLSPPKPCETL